MTGAAIGCDGWTARLIRLAFGAGIAPVVLISALPIGATILALLNTMGLLAATFWLPEQDAKTMQAVARAIPCLITDTLLCTALRGNHYFCVEPVAKNRGIVD